MTPVLGRPAEEILDVNVSLGRWPFQPLEPSSAGQLVRHMERLGISSAVVSSLDAVLHADPQWGNSQLFRLIRGAPQIIPCAVINPTLANGSASLRSCHAAGARMVKLFPNYHLYSLGDERVDELVTACSSSGMLVAIALRLEDERAQNPLMKVPATPVHEIVQLAQRHQNIPFLALCALLHEAQELAFGSPNIRVEISHIEQLDTLNSLRKHVPLSRILFGSHTPFLYAGASLAKLQDAPLSDKDIACVAAGNAQRILRSLAGCWTRQTRER